MMTPEDVHRDVGAYALGVLEPRDSARFEEHLTACRRCPHELEELSSVAALLSHVSPDSLVFTERPAREPRRPEQPAGPVRQERRRGRTRRTLTLAACLALLFAGAAVAVSLRFGAPAGLPVPAALTNPQLHAVSSTTGAEATLQVDRKRWGSQVTLKVDHVKGPVTCRLIAVSKTGRSEIVMGWNEPPKGYGGSADPGPLVIYGGTDIAPSDLARFEVRTVGGALLVNVPT